MLSPETTVREIALQLPDSTRVFEEYKIDYCCGGDQPLDRACAAAGIAVEQVMSMIAGIAEAKAKSEHDFTETSIPDLITHIVETHHVFTKAEMERLEALTFKVVSAHGANHPELLRLQHLFAQLCNELRPHMFKEEQVLFPYMVAMTTAAEQKLPAPFAPFGTVNNPIRMMMREHDGAGEILRELRVLTADYTLPADACASYQTLYQALDSLEKDLHQHIHLENNILFPNALDLERTMRG